MFIYFLRETERRRDRGRETERERHRIQSRLQALSCHHSLTYWTTQGPLSLLFSIPLVTLLPVNCHILPSIFLQSHPSLFPTSLSNIYLLIFNLYPQCRAWTHNPGIESPTRLQLSQPGAPLLLLMSPRSRLSLSLTWTSCKPFWRNSLCVS